MVNPVLGLNPNVHPNKASGQNHLPMSSPLIDHHTPGQVTAPQYLRIFAQMSSGGLATRTPSQFRLLLTNHILPNDFQAAMELPPTNGTAHQSIKTGIEKTSRALRRSVGPSPSRNHGINWSVGSSGIRSGIWRVNPVIKGWGVPHRSIIGGFRAYGNKSWVLMRVKNVYCASICWDSVSGSPI